MSIEKQKTPREILDKVYMQGWRDCEHPKCTPITMQEMEVNKAKKDLSTWILGHKKKLTHREMNVSEVYYRTEGFNAALEQLAGEV